MRFEDLTPGDRPPVGTIVSEWCAECSRVMLHKVTDHGGRECAGCRWGAIAAMIGSTPEKLCEADAAEDRHGEVVRRRWTR